MYPTSTSRFLLARHGVILLVLTVTLTTHAAAENGPITHRLLLAEYGKGPNRLLELDANGTQVWDYRPPSTTVALHATIVRPVRSEGMGLLDRR